MTSLTFQFSPSVFINLEPEYVLTFCAVSAAVLLILGQQTNCRCRSDIYVVQHVALLFRTCVIARVNCPNVKYWVVCYFV
ncbi:hypothetical protein LENED_008563 [Lentinula edodes]|uniref:Uncharacterized protein n=1 Tax=Lentinula edodes TaxID=5353 RepID=A0A1Q3EHG4_LENED|nr:hypothetical protein LENED_008563 [Lentinula edodes]